MESGGMNDERMKSQTQQTIEAHFAKEKKLRNKGVKVLLRFIFSHSALREGWDNPNVFQICTLREMGTDRERRQTIGRGLRLPVNQDGERIKDDQINRLTVIANESFENFAKGLQSDIEAAIDPSGGFRFGRVPPIAFTPLLNPAGTNYLTQEDSKEVWGYVAEQGYIDQHGDFTPAFQPEKAGFSLNLPDKYSGIQWSLKQINSLSLPPVKSGAWQRSKRYRLRSRGVIWR